MTIAAKESATDEVYMMTDVLIASVFGTRNCDVMIWIRDQGDAVNIYHLPCLLFSGICIPTYFKVIPVSCPPS